MTMSREEHRRAMFDLCVAHITSPAESRMRLRTAKEQHAAALDALKAPDDVPLPDAAEESTTRAGVLL